jgi:hypothetical protein
MEPEQPRPGGGRGSTRYRQGRMVRHRSSRRRHVDHAAAAGPRQAARASQGPSVRQSPKNAQEQVLIRPAAKIVMVALGHQRRHTILGAISTVPVSAPTSRYSRQNRIVPTPLTGTGVSARSVSIRETRTLSMSSGSAGGRASGMAKSAVFEPERGPISTWPSCALIASISACDQVNRPGITTSP